MSFLRLLIPSAAVLLLQRLPAFAQTDSVALSEEYYNQGMEVFGFAHRKQAAELFVLATQMNPRNARAQLMAGQSIMLSIQKEKSLSYFKKAWNIDPHVDENILYYLAQAYHYSEKFDSAILFYDRYNRILARSLNLEKSVRINEVNRKIFECRNAAVYMAHPVQVTITDLDDKINSEYPDYAPTISEDESLMVFTSRRPGDNLNERVAADHEYYEEIYIAEKVNGEWKAARNPGPPLNTGYHNASVNLSPDGTEIIIYHDTNGGDLLLANRNPDGTWSAPKPIDGVNTEFLESSATITEDDKKIYFTSNRPGGYGGTDVYSCELGKGGRWINVKNLGPLVNTELDEEGVFISASGEHLYFSSNGLAGMGDLDFYRSTYNPAKGEWGEPVNLGYPINSVENDIYFVLTADEKFAYISSLRQDNLGEQDIYKIDMTNWKPVILDQPGFLEVFAEPSVPRQLSPAPPVNAPDEGAEKKDVPGVQVTGLPTTSMNVIWRIVDNGNGSSLDPDLRLNDESGKGVDVKKESAGMYSATLAREAGTNASYRLQVSLAGYVPYHSSFYFQGATDNGEISETIRLDPVPSNTHVVNVGYVLNVYFSHDNTEPLSFEGIRNLVQMIKHSPTMKVEIGGHTDSSGPETYNMGLSKRRAEVVRNYLIQGGADANRITAVGYGESRPIEANDTREGRQLNRRIEFIILEP